MRNSPSGSQTRLLLIACPFCGGKMRGERAKGYTCFSCRALLSSRFVAQLHKNEISRLIQTHFVEELQNKSQSWKQMNQEPTDLVKIDVSESESCISKVGVSKLTSSDLNSDLSVPEVIVSSLNAMSHKPRPQPTVLNRPAPKPWQILTKKQVFATMTKKKPLVKTVIAKSKQTAQNTRTQTAQHTRTKRTPSRATAKKLSFSKSTVKPGMKSTSGIKKSSLNSRTSKKRRA